MTAFAGHPRFLAPSIDQVRNPDCDVGHIADPNFCDGRYKWGLFPAARATAISNPACHIFLILMPDGAFLVTLLVLQSAQLGFAATILPRE